MVVWIGHIHFLSDSSFTNLPGIRCAATCDVYETSRFKAVCLFSSGTRNVNG